MRKSAVPFLIIFLLSCIATSQQPEQGTYDDIARRVEKEIRDAKKVQIEDLKVLHNSGAIYLEGVTDLYGSRYLAEKEALEEKGIKSVINEIAVKSSNVPDSEIEANAIAKIRSHLKGSPFDLISIKVSNGFVTLTGNVRDQSLVKDGEESVIWIRGVRGLTNKIEYGSIAAGDERLRRAIFQRLNREFPQYFIGRDPSIIILVNSGRVQLEGWVESNVTREKIGSIIRSFNGVLSVQNNLQVS